MAGEVIANALIRSPLVGKDHRRGQHVSLRVSKQLALSGREPLSREPAPNTVVFLSWDRFVASLGI